MKFKRSEKGMMIHISRRDFYFVLFVAGTNLWMDGCTVPIYVCTYIQPGVIMMMMVMVMIRNVPFEVNIRI